MPARAQAEQRDYENDILHLEADPHGSIRENLEVRALYHVRSAR